MVIVVDEFGSLVSLATLADVLHGGRRRGPDARQTRPNAECHRNTTPSYDNEFLPAWAVRIGSQEIVVRRSSTRQR